MRKTAHLMAAVAGAFLLAGLPAQAGDPTNMCDVVGNAGFQGISGHVGLYDGWGKIVEVYLPVDDYSINGSCVHYGRTLDQFKEGGYWGARGYNDLADVALANVFDIFRVQGYARATYSLWPPSFRFKTSLRHAWVMKGRTNRLQRKQIVGPAVLRCDFAIAAAYREKTGRNLAGTRPFLPHTVYLKLPVER